MAFQLSPGVLVKETDLTNIVPAISTSTGAFAGTFRWGPVLDPTLVSSEAQMVSMFGKPVVDNATSFFTAANFLSYSASLYLVRTETDSARNAVSSFTGTVTSTTIDSTLSDGSYVDAVITFGAPDVTGGIQATGTAVIGGGEITDITITNPGSGYTSAPTITITSASGTGTTATATITSGGIKINNESDYLDTYANGAGVVGEWAAKYPGSLGNSLKVSMADSATFDTWVYKDEFDSAPGSSSYAISVGANNDEVHVVVVDTDGLWTNTPGAIIEKYTYLSKASGAKSASGVNNYYKDVINTSSKYIWWMDHTASVEGTAAAWGTFIENAGTFDDLSAPVTIDLSGGVDDLSSTDGQLITGFSHFANTDLYDVSLVMTGAVSPVVSKYTVENLAEVRKDCMVFISPCSDVGTILQGSDLVQKTVNFRTQISFNVDSSYAVLDSGWKYQYDIYNDTYRWVPLNGDIAGLCARTDYTNDPWWSPGGLNRGKIKNVVKLSYNPNKTERDELYKNGINPVVSFPGQGTVLFGDKTLATKASAFDRINVRRLFIVLEKSIATASKYQLFELNDSFTRNQFVATVEPFLRSVKGRRGITDYKVVCDETNNPSDTIDRNEFVADIYIKPARSINFITLNFVAVRTGASFSEVVGD